MLELMLNSAECEVQKWTQELWCAGGSVYFYYIYAVLLWKNVLHFLGFFFPFFLLLLLIFLSYLNVLYHEANFDMREW